MVNYFRELFQQGQFALVSFSAGTTACGKDIRHTQDSPFDRNSATAFFDQVGRYDAVPGLNLFTSPPRNFAVHCHPKHEEWWISWTRERIIKEGNLCECADACGLLELITSGSMLVWHHLEQEQSPAWFHESQKAYEDQQQIYESSHMREARETMFLEDLTESRFEIKADIF